jgi:uncharacterized damage-inducible protein DinB
MELLQTQRKSAFQSLLIDFANYNYWANKQLVDWLTTKPEELMDTEVPSSFSSIRKTLLHIKDTQAYWLDKILQQQDDDEEEVDSQELSDTNCGICQVFDSIIDQSGVMASIIETYDDSALQEEVCVVSPWFESVQPRFELIQHCMNHSTYHRGQIITISRNLGFTDAPMTDFNFYLLQIKG